MDLAHPITRPALSLMRSSDPPAQRATYRKL